MHKTGPVAGARGLPGRLPCSSYKGKHRSMLESLAQDIVEHPQAVAADPAWSARLAGLRYVSDDRPGIRRRRRGKGFSYLDAEGRPLREVRERRRIAALAVPPAWTGVWICPRANGHLQATGRDARGRQQDRY